MTSGTLDNSEDSPRGFGHGISDANRVFPRWAWGVVSVCAIATPWVTLRFTSMSLPLIEKGPSAGLEEL